MGKIHCGKYNEYIANKKLVISEMIYTIPPKVREYKVNCGKERNKVK